jgi:hypothetical protein
MVVEDHVDVEVRGDSVIDRVEKLAKLGQRPMTVPVLTFHPAKSDVVPWRT